MFLCESDRGLFIFDGVGYVDVGKLILMGWVFYDIGEFFEKEKMVNEWGSKKVGKGFFVFVWGFDVLGDECDCGVIIDIVIIYFVMFYCNFILFDVFGYRDFIFVMISGVV